MVDGVVMTQDIFQFILTGYKQRRILGEFRATSSVPKRWEQISAANLTLSSALYEGQ